MLVISTDSFPLLSDHIIICRKQFVLVKIYHSLPLREDGHGIEVALNVQLHSWEAHSRTSSVWGNAKLLIST